MHNNRKGQVFWGLTFIAIAILAVAGGMGFLGGLSVWSVILTIMFVIVLIRSIYPLNFAGILFSLAFLGIIYDKQLGIESITPWTILLVALLGSIGLTMIFGSHCGRKRSCSGHCQNHRYTGNDTGSGTEDDAANGTGNDATYGTGDDTGSGTGNDTENGRDESPTDGNYKGAGDGYENGGNQRMDNSEVINEPDDSHVYQNTQFGGTTKYVNSNNFVEADLECKFGGLSVYFNNAQVKGHNAMVHIYASFAGVELYFPKEWTIIDNIRCSIGGVSYDNAATPSGDVTVTLDGDVSVGGVTIKFI